MKITPLFVLMLFPVMVNISGCGVGGFENPANSNSSGGSGNATTMVSGVAAKGIIKNGTIGIYAINANGTVGALLKTAHTNAFGYYTTNMRLTGAILAKATGTYTDEATGLEMAIDDNNPLRAAIETITNPTPLSVTPFTELALMKAQVFINGTITAANTLISSLFKVDIIATQPIVLSAELFGDANTRQAQKDYTLALAAFSQMAHDYYNGSMSQTLSALYADINSGNELSSSTAANFKTALINFLNSDKNPTGLRDINLTNLVNAGGSVKAVKIATTGTLPAGKSICGITMTLQLPAKVTVKADFSTNNYQPLSGVVTTSGVVPLGSLSAAEYTPSSGSVPASLTISLAYPSGFGLGEFVTVYCDIPAGETRQATDFNVSELKAVDENGVVLPNVIWQLTY
jgi:hypothetical protein